MDGWDQQAAIVRYSIESGIGPTAQCMHVKRYQLPAVLSEACSLLSHHHQQHERPLPLKRCVRRRLSSAPDAEYSIKVPRTVHHRIM